MQGLPRSLCGASALLLGAAGASANDFNYSSVPDGVVITQAAPLTLVAPDDATLTATFTPMNENGSFTKRPADAHFNLGTAGYLDEAEAPAGGIKICFNKPVFCVPGWGVGEFPIIEITDPSVKWTTYFKGEVVATGEAVMESDPDTGAIIADFAIPDGVIDCVELVAYRSMVDAEPVPFPMMLGDFFAVSVDQRCPADWNYDLFLNDQDFFDFVNDFFTGTGSRATKDFNQDGFENDQDFFDFMNAFFNPIASCGA